MSERVSVNEKECWGGLINPGSHEAAVGMRLIDDGRRSLTYCPDRVTCVGDLDMVTAMQRWLSSEATRKLIRKNTKFTYGLDDADPWVYSTALEGFGDFVVHMVVRCAGEYCYVAAYADPKNPNEYFMLVEEWLYPTESGREPVDVTFKCYAEALEYADSMCERERDNFAKACGCDASGADHYFPSDGLDADPAGSIISDRYGLEEWWYGVRIVPMKYGLENWEGVRRENDAGHRRK